MNHSAPESGVASLLASRGRGDDSMLIHMTPGEVHGLQRLAVAHGGSLTLNPHTGLPEAGILKSLLPALIGFGLTFTGLGPLAAAGLVGAGETIRTKGDLGKGLMAGLGAFGGAGLGAGLAGAAGAGSQAALTGVTSGATQAATTAGTQAAATTAAQAAGTEAAKQGALQQLQTMGQGVKALGNQFGREGFMSAIPGGVTGIAAGGAGLAGAMTPEYKMPDIGGGDSPYWESYGYDEGEGRFLGGRWLPSYPGVPKKKGKGMADGGMVNPNRDPGGMVIPAPPPRPTGLSPDMALDDYLRNVNQFITSPVTPQRSAQPTQPPTTPPPRNPGGPRNPSSPRWDGGLNEFSTPRQFGNVNFGGLAGLAGARNLDQFLANSRPGSLARSEDGGPPRQQRDEYQYNPFVPGVTLPDFMQDYEQPSILSRTNPSTPAPATYGVDFSGSDLGDYMGSRGGPQTTPYSEPETREYAQPVPTEEPPVYDQRQAPPYMAAPSYEPPAQNYDWLQAYQQPTPTPYSEPETYESIMPVDDYFGGGEKQNDMQRRYAFEDSDTMMFAAGGPTQYAAGGKFLRGPGDGMSDDIQANIEGKQEARLADGEFVVPADVVSHLGNGSSEAGSRRLYKMMADIRKARTGTHKQAPAVKGEKYLPR